MYQTQFPDYDPATLPPIPSHWVDVSHRNAACPSWQVHELLIYVDYLAPQDREFSEVPRFSVHFALSGIQMMLPTDNWQEVLDCVDNFADAGIDAEADRSRA